MQIFKGPRPLIHVGAEQPERQRNPKQLAKPSQVASKADHVVLLAEANHVSPNCDREK